MLPDSATCECRSEQVFTWNLIVYYPYVRAIWTASSGVVDHFLDEYSEDSVLTHDSFHPLETRFPFSPASCLAMSSKEQDFRSF